MRQEERDGGKRHEQGHADDLSSEERHHALERLAHRHVRRPQPAKSRDCCGSPSWQRSGRDDAPPPARPRRRSRPQARRAGQRQRHGALSRAIARDKSSITPLIRDLVDHDLVRRARSKTDRRSEWMMKTLRPTGGVISPSSTTMRVMIPYRSSDRRPTSRSRARPRKLRHLQILGDETGLSTT